MANLFEKPQTANPRSTFKALPLQFIHGAIQQRQKSYDTAKAEVLASEDVLLGTKALTGDVERHREILADKQSKIDSIIEAADGDYSQIRGPLDVLKREMNSDMQHGELGAINNAYKKGTAHIADAQKLYQKGDISRAGYEKILRETSKHQTLIQDNGGFNPFQGYSASNVTDPLKIIQDSADEIKAKYDSEGMKYVDSDTIKGNIANKLTTNPDIVKALRENFEGGYAGSLTFPAYVNKMIGGVVRDKAFQEVDSTTSTSTGQYIPGTRLEGVQMPRISGDGKYQGGSMTWGRAMAKSIGFDTTATFDKFSKSSEGQRMITYMAKKTGNPFPTDYSDQVEWFEENMNRQMTATIETGEANAKVLKTVMTNGFLNHGSAVYALNGRKLDADEIGSIQGKSEEGNQARVLGVVKQGGTYPPGSYLIMGKDGQRYIQEPSDPKTLSSREFNMGLINQVKLMNTGVSNVTLQGAIKDPSGATAIPMGSYKAVHDLADTDKNGNVVKPESIVLYKGGQPVYRIMEVVENGVRKQKIFQKTE